MAVTFAVVVPVYAIALVLGILAGIPFVVGVGPRLRRPVTAGLLGVGLGGLSASFAGWASPVAALAALVAAGALGALAVTLDPERPHRDSP